MEKSLEFSDISMSFSGVKALSNVSFKVHGGETLAMVGENGAGKSTLLKILGGDYQPTSGYYKIDGQNKRFLSPNEAIQAGVGLIYQERQMVPELTVAENVFMGNFPEKHGIVDFKQINNATKVLLDEFGLDISPRTKVKNLSVAMQQMVEIIKIYSRKPKLIAFDEPTTALTTGETEALFNIIETKLKKQNIIIIYVSHRMNEIFRLADRIVTLKDGQLVAIDNVKDTTVEKIIEQMVGRPLQKAFAELECKPPSDQVILKVNGLTGGNFKRISFYLKKGEILGFFGLVGAGRTELMRGIFGADEVYSGYLEFEGKRCKLNSPKESVKRGIGFLTEDRKEQGIIPIGSIRDNLSIVVLKRFNRWLFINRKAENEFAEDAVEKYNIKTPNIFKKISELSGGNQQKSLIARWLSMNPKIIILDEPTKGIDVGAKSEIYKLVRDIANSGISVILVSSEMPEIIGLSDRIKIMKSGEIVGELTRSEASEQALINYAMVGSHQGVVN